MTGCNLQPNASASPRVRSYTLDVMVNTEPYLIKEENIIFIRENEELFIFPPPKVWRKECHKKKGWQSCGLNTKSKHTQVRFILPSGKKWRHSLVYSIIHVFMHSIIHVFNLSLLRTKHQAGGAVEIRMLRGHTQNSWDPQFLCGIQMLMRSPDKLLGFRGPFELLLLWASLMTLTPTIRTERRSLPTSSLYNEHSWKSTSTKQLYPLIIFFCPLLSKFPGEKLQDCALLTSALFWYKVCPLCPSLEFTDFPGPFLCSSSSKAPRSSCPSFSTNFFYSRILYRVELGWWLDLRDHTYLFLCNSSLLLF